LEHTLMIFAPYALFMLPAAALDSCMLARDKVAQVAIFNVLRRVVLLVIVVGAALIWRTATAAIIAVVVSAAVTLGPAIALMYSATKGTRPDISWTGARGQLKLSIPLALGGMIAMFSAQIDKVIVSSMCSDLREVAIYLNGAIELPLIDIVTASVMCVILPDLTTHFKEGRLGELLVLWRTAAEKCLMILAPGMAFVLVMAPELMTVLFSSTYTESAYPLRIYALLLPMRATQLATVFLAAGRSGFVTLAATVGLAVNVVLSILLVKWMGPAGAAWATVISLYAMTIFAFVAIGSVLKCRLTDVIRFPRVCWTIASACLPGVAIYLLRGFVPGGMVMRLAILTPVFAILLVIAYHITGVVSLSQIVHAVSSRIGRKLSTPNDDAEDTES
jgi:O-antigen/teichoic acid export membrane protein